MHLAPISLLACLASSATAKAIDMAFARSIDPEDIHRRALSAVPARNIIDSSELYSYMEAYNGTDEVLYLRDDRSFVPLTAEIHSLSKRQGTGPCTAFTKYNTINAKAEWGPWNPVSECKWNGLNDKDAVEVTAWSHTVAFTTSAGVEWSPIKDVLAISLGFAVTESWTKSGELRCTIGAGSVGQIWAQNYMGSADVQTRLCQTCPSSAGETCVSDWETKGNIVAPADRDPQLGCSTGQENVKCD